LLTVVHECLEMDQSHALFWLFCRESGRAGRDGLPSHSILYYSADDVGKFRYLIRMQSSNKKGNEKGEDQNLERKLSHLEEMEKYCTELKCRRNTLIGHFGGKTVDCRRTCDFCIDPKKVETALRSAKATKDTRNQNRGGGHKQPWDGQWDGPHGESSAFANEWRNDGLMVGDLRVTGPLEVDPGIPESNTTSSGSGVSFVKASDILSKYEAMEGRAHRYGGFGDSEPGSNAKSSSVSIPDHLIASLNAASAKAMKEKSRETKSQKILTSQDHAKSVDEIEKQLAKIKAEREARLKALLEKQGGKTARPPPPPPPLSFGRKK
jgi:RecQ zinc-binding